MEVRVHANECGDELVSNFVAGLFEQGRVRRDVLREVDEGAAAETGAVNKGGHFDDCGEGAAVVGNIGDVEIRKRFAEEQRGAEDSLVTEVAESLMFGGGERGSAESGGSWSGSGDYNVIEVRGRAMGDIYTDGAGVGRGDGGNRLRDAAIDAENAQFPFEACDDAGVATGDVAEQLRFCAGATGRVHACDGGPDKGGGGLLGIFAELGAEERLPEFAGDAAARVAFEPVNSRNFFERTPIANSRGVQNGGGEASFFKETERRKFQIVDGAGERVKAGVYVKTGTGFAPDDLVLEVELMKERAETGV